MPGMFGYADPNRNRSPLAPTRALAPQAAAPMQRPMMNPRPMFGGGPPQIDPRILAARQAQMGQMAPRPMMPPEGIPQQPIPIQQGMGGIGMGLPPDEQMRQNLLRRSMFSAAQGNPTNPQMMY